MELKGLHRNTIDKFYTKPSIVDLCISNISKYLTIDKNKTWFLEPSAGNGAWINGIKKLSDNAIFLDIQPEANNIIQMDYLNFDINTLNFDISKSKIHVVGNPPFGRQSSLAIKFIKKSAEFAHSISFILPKSFKKDSMKKAFPLNFHLVFEIDLPENSFLVEDKECDVPCIFQIWVKSDSELRSVKEKLEPLNFTFVKRQEADANTIAFRRVGVNAGKTSRDIMGKSEQSHYFIRFSDIVVDDALITKLDSIVFDTNNTVGPKSISKQELIEKYNII